MKKITLGFLTAAAAIVLNSVSATANETTLTKGQTVQIVFEKTGGRTVQPPKVTARLLSQSVRYNAQGTLQKVRFELRNRGRRTLNLDQISSQMSIIARGKTQTMQSQFIWWVPRGRTSGKLSPKKTRRFSIAFGGKLDSSIEHWNPEIKGSRAATFLKLSITEPAKKSLIAWRTFLRLPVVRIVK
ncbi:MAG: hypothetical protein HY401_08160 [Elusimicrobia bacterium]|nr:hypothetical protein [Elusimicrobiota bacterium]